MSFVAKLQRARENDEPHRMCGDSVDRIAQIREQPSKKVQEALAHTDSGGDSAPFTEWGWL